jgi:hypothetical protein
VARSLDKTGACSSVDENNRHSRASLSCLFVFTRQPSDYTSLHFTSTLHFHFDFQQT